MVGKNNWNCVYFTFHINLMWEKRIFLNPTSVTTVYRRERFKEWSKAVVFHLGIIFSIWRNRLIMIFKKKIKT